MQTPTTAARSYYTMISADGVSAYMFQISRDEATELVYVRMDIPTGATIYRPGKAPEKETRRHHATVTKAQAREMWTDLKSKGFRRGEDYHHGELAA